MSQPRWFVIRDEWALSPIRLWYAFWLWLWMLLDDTHIPIWYMLRFHRRPHARQRYDVAHRQR